jgi:PAS domain S-box-containing protein
LRFDKSRIGTFYAADGLKKAGCVSAATVIVDVTVDRSGMQRRLFSLKAHFLALGGALTAPVVVLTGLALSGASAEVILVVGIVLLACVLGLAWTIGRRFAAAADALKAAVGRLGRGEDVALAPSFREGRELVAALAAVGTDLKQHALALHESEERYKAIAESVPAMVWIVGGDGQALFQNRCVTEYAGEPGWAEADAQARLIHPDDRSLLPGPVRGPHGVLQDQPVEVRLRRHDGRYRWHLVTVAQFSLSGADEALFVTTAIDIENLKQAEELQARLTGVLEKKVTEATEQLREETVVRQKAERQLRQTQKMEAISRLTGGIAHDLNNKLMVISANIDAVTKQIKDQPLQRRKLLAALVASDQAAALISKLLAFAQQRDLHVQYIDIAEHLGSISSLLDRSLMTDSIEVNLSIPEDLWPVETDPHELETAIVNLCVNARDAMPKGGMITIEARNIRVRSGALSDPNLSGDFVQIVIADTGEGIAPQYLDHVFEPFFTTKAATRASGLGLSQVHGFVKQLGGTVEISSVVGRGTSVVLYLPKADLPARIGTKPELEDLVDDEEPEKPAAEILVVDDEVEVALALQSMLEEAGYAVRTALNAQEALTLLALGKPNLLLTDVTMPGTMDGLALARQVRQIHPDLPVVLITGNPMVVAASSDFPLLQKPITSRQLDATIRRHLAPSEDQRVVQLFPRLNPNSP